MAASSVVLTSAMRQNLFTLTNTSKLMDVAQNRLSTGLKVASALDDPINYFAALGHTQRATDLAGRKDEMGEAIQLVKAANTGIEAITDMIASAKSLAQSAKSATTTGEANTLGSQFNDLMDQIDTLAGDSFYKGINLLDGSSQALTLTFDQDGGSKITLTGFGGSSGGLSINDAVTGAASTYWADASAVSSGAIESALSELDSATTTLRSKTQTLTNQLSTITTRQDFTQGMMNTLEDGAANLVNADLNEEGANMLMLQTRQTLGTTALSLASQAAQSVLRLF